jgi:hypothetical protein
MLLESSGLTVPHWIVSRLNDSKPLLPPEPVSPVGRAGQGEDLSEAKGHVQGRSVEHTAQLRLDDTPAGGLGSSLIVEARRDREEASQSGTPASQEERGGARAAGQEGGEEEEEEEEEGVEWWEESGVEAVEAQLRLWAVGRPS